MRRMQLVVALLAAFVPWSTTANAAPSGRDQVTPCSRGLVALTFDDGPSATVTPRLVRLLDRLDVPATFFMVGSRVAAEPAVARMVEQHGFAIGNHTWIHTDLTTQTDAEITQAMRSTHRAMTAAGLHPTDLARPPYGAIDDRVRGVLTGLGLVPVLWTIDSRDWTGLSPAQIRARIGSAVRPHRTNVVLQHDGVANSPATLRALPEEIAGLRRRGFCFAALDGAGLPTPPVPVASVSTDRRRADEGERVAITVRLDRPTTRRTTVQVHGWGARQLRFAPGTTVARFRLRVPQDSRDESGEELVTRVGSSTATVRVRDDDPRPTVSLRGDEVTASPLLDTPTGVTLRLDRRSGRDVRVRVKGPEARTWVDLAAGARTAVLPVTVPPGTPLDEVRTWRYRIVRSVHADADPSVVTITVRPPAQTRSEVARAAFDQAAWPDPMAPGLF